MADIQILLSHPNFAHSRSNQAWMDAVSDLPGVKVTQLDGLYPDGRIALDSEVARLIAARRIILQFPI